MGPSLLAVIANTLHGSTQRRTHSRSATHIKQGNSRVPGVAFRPRLRLPGVEVGEDIVAETPVKQVAIVGSVLSQV